MKPADPDFLPVDAFAPEEPTASDDEYQPEEANEEEEKTKVPRKRKIESEKATSPAKTARKTKSPIGKFSFSTFLNQFSQFITTFNFRKICHITKNAKIKKVKEKTTHTHFATI